MTPTPPSSTSSHSPQDHLASSNGYRIVRKRNRVPLSCGPCRNRKLKCNRQTPCENCVRRNDAQSCTYATNTHPGRHRKTSATSGGSSSSSDEMQSRIDRLEGLVLSLMSGNSNNVSPQARDTLRNSPPGDAIFTEPHDGDAEGDYDAMGYGEQEEQEGDCEGEGHEAGDEEQEQSAGTQSLDAEVEEVRNALGIMKVHGGKSFYRGATHWAALLMEIKEVKKYFEDTKQKYEQAMRSQAVSGFPFSASPPPTKEEILGIFPEKPTVDLLVDTYFRNHDPLFHVLHRPSFYKQYDEFWRDQSEADIIWIGLLFIIMSVAVKIYNSSGEPPLEFPGSDGLDMVLAFRNASEQCLVVGEYTKKLYLHTVQALLLLCFSSSEEGGWLLLGSVVRLAMMMGLHRDPGQFSAISAGEGEIRRRLWTQIACMDLLTSIQVGLPSMIKEDQCDTRLPRNLHDNEVGEGVDTLPRERDREELTGICYMINKASMAHALWEIVRQVNSVNARPPYEQVLKLEAEINARYEQIPSFLRLQSIENSAHDPAWLIIQRHNLSMLRQVAMLTLHRPYAARVRSTPRFAHSYRQCIESAMALLSHQDDISTQGATTLRHARWYTDSHCLHQYLHAATIVSLDLSDPHQYSTSDPQERKKMFAALNRARDVYESLKTASYESSKAFNVITIMLKRLACNDVKRETAAQPPSSPPPSSPPPPFERRLTSLFASNRSPLDFPSTTTTSSEAVGGGRAAALSLGLMPGSGGGLTPNSAFNLLLGGPVVSTPGGTLQLPDASAPSPPQQPLQPALAESSPPPPGWNSMWTNGGFSVFDMPNVLGWQEWEEFMSGVNLDTSQLGGYPVLPGIGAFPSNAAQERLEKSRENPGGGIG